MKTTNKALTVFGVTMAVLFLATGASFAASISSPVELAYCHAIERGLAFQCDPATSLQVVNSTSPVIPVTGFAPLAFSTNLRRVNEIGLSVDDLSLSDSALALAGAADFSLSDFALSLTGAVATSLRGVNDFTPSATELILADFVANPSATELILADFVANPSATELILADFVANPSAVATSLRGVNSVDAAVSVLSLSDEAISIIPAMSLSDEALSLSSAPVMSLSDFAISVESKDNAMMAEPAAFYYGGR